MPKKTKKTRPAGPNPVLRARGLRQHDIPPSGAPADPSGLPFPIIDAGRASGKDCLPFAVPAIGPPSNVPRVPQLDACQVVALGGWLDDREPARRKGSRQRHVAHPLSAPIEACREGSGFGGYSGCSASSQDAISSGTFPTDRIWPFLPRPHPTRQSWNLYCQYEGRRCHS